MVREQHGYDISASSVQITTSTLAPTTPDASGSGDGELTAAVAAAAHFVVSCTAATCCGHGSLF